MIRWATRAAVQLVLLISACATLPPPAPADRTHSGRFSLQLSENGKRESSSGRFSLAVRGADLTLDLATPIGTTLARVELTPGGARLTAPSPDGIREIRGADPESLTRELLGWPLPVAGIADWILGRPAPDRPAEVHTEAGRAVSFEQDGWAIAVLERFDHGTGAPRRLSIARAGREQPGISPAITLRLVLDAPAAD